MKLRGCYCECGEGWQGIISALDAQLSGDCQVCQVKEKYGTLRVYVGEATEADLDYIDEAEYKSMIVCELCGKPGEIRERYGWVSVACDEH